MFIVQVAPRSSQVCESLELEEQAIQCEVREVDEATEIELPNVNEPAIESEQEEEDDGDAENEADENLIMPFVDIDAEVHIEIDLFGIRDLLNDDRLDETV